MSDKDMKRKDLMKSFRTDTVNGDADRRRFLQGSLAATVASTVGLSGLIGGAAAKTNRSENRTFELITNDVDVTLVDEVAAPLLQKLAADGVLPEASSASFPSYGLTNNDKPGGVAAYRVVETDLVERTAVGFFDDKKVIVNMPETGQPYAIVTPEDETASKTRYELGVDGVESTSYGSGGYSIQSCSDSCGGYTCSDAGNCWWEQRYCTEDCVDGSCHESCQCGCP